MYSVLYTPYYKSSFPPFILSVGQFSTYLPPFDGSIHRIFVTYIDLPLLTYALHSHGKLLFIGFEPVWEPGLSAFHHFASKLSCRLFLWTVLSGGEEFDVVRPVFTGLTLANSLSFLFSSSLPVYWELFLLFLFSWTRCLCMALFTFFWQFFTNQTHDWPLVNLTLCWKLLHFAVS